MSVVYLAKREDLRSEVAIKILPNAWMSPARRERFALEQRTQSRLNHPSIARLYDAGVLDDGTPWFAMEYVEGRPFIEYCEKIGAALEQRLRLFRSVCEAVQYAHQQAILHRDLKPSNILVKADGAIRLLDFGIAKQLDPMEGGIDLTRTGLGLATPAYAAPEQVRGEPAAIQADVYSLANLSILPSNSANYIWKLHKRERKHKFQPQDQPRRQRAYLESHGQRLFLPPLFKVFTQRRTFRRAPRSYHGIRGWQIGTSESQSPSVSNIKSGGASTRSSHSTQFNTFNTIANPSPVQNQVPLEFCEVKANPKIGHSGLAVEPHAVTVQQYSSFGIECSGKRPN